VKASRDSDSGTLTDNPDVAAHGNEGRTERRYEQAPRSVPGIALDASDPGPPGTPTLVGCLRRYRGKKLSALPPPPHGSCGLMRHGSFGLFRFSRCLRKTTRHMTPQGPARRDRPRFWEPRLRGGIHSFPVPPRAPVPQGGAVFWLPCRLTVRQSHVFFARSVPPEIAANRPEDETTERRQPMITEDRNGTFRCDCGSTVWQCVRASREGQDACCANCKCLEFAARGVR
jgi:hypothetical protein